jgi:hypothetical protein
MFWYDGKTMEIVECRNSEKYTVSDLFTYLKDQKILVYGKKLLNIQYVSHLPPSSSLQNILIPYIYLASSAQYVC